MEFNRGGAMPLLQLLELLVDRVRGLGLCLQRQRPEFWAKCRQNVARFRLYRHRFLHVNTRFTTFFKIYQIIKVKFLRFGKILQIFRYLQNVC